MICIQIDCVVYETQFESDRHKRSDLTFAASYEIFLIVYLCFFLLSFTIVLLINQWTFGEPLKKAENH